MSLLIMVMWGIFLLSVLKRRWNLPISIAVLFGGVMCLYIVGLRIPYTLLPYRMLFAFAGLVLCTFLAFKDKPGKIILAAGMMYVDVFTCEIVVLASIPNVSISKDWMDLMAPADRVLTLIYYLAVLSVLLFLSARLFNRKSSRLSTKEWLLFALLPISQTLLMSLSFLSTQGVEPGKIAVWQIVAGVTCIFADIFLFLAIQWISQRAELKAQNELLEKQITAQKQHYADLTQQYQRIRVMRHDIANHVRTIQVLLKNGELQEAQKYADETMAAHTFHSSLGECENPIVDAFLVSRIADANAQEIAIETDVRLPYELNMKDTDLITIFGNLLDNAVEASLPLPPGQRTIRLAAAVQSGYLAIRMENGLPEQAKPAKTARIDGLERGLGFRILEDMAKQYGGVFKGASEDGRFISTLTLCLEEAEHASNRAL